jgi:hypothetical protein
MRPKTVTVTGSNDPFLIPLSYRADSTSVHAQVTGTIDYTISYTLQNIYAFADPAADADWVAITDMTAATATATKKVDGSVNCLKIVVNSGAGSVDVTVSQPDSI